MSGIADTTVEKHYSVPSIDYATIMSYDVMNGNLYFTLGTTVRQYSGDSCDKKRFELSYHVNLNTSSKPTLISANIISKEQKVKFWSPSRNICILGYSNGELVIMKNGVHVKTVNTSKLHADFCDDVIFSSTSWDDKEEFLLYQAERIKSPDANSLNQFAYCSSWGEKLDGRVYPGLFLLSLNHFSIEEINTPHDISPSSGCLVGNQVYFVGYHHPKFGLYYCYNRPSSLYSWSKESKTIELVLEGSSNRNISSLRRRGNSLFYLSREVGKSHFGAASLNRLDLDSMECTEIKSDIFTEWIEKFGSSVILNMVFDCQRVIHMIANGSSFTISRLNESIQALDSMDNNILAKTSSPGSLPFLEFVADEKSYRLNIEHLVPINPASKISSVETKSLSDISNYFTVEPFDPNGCLIVIPHGGPNSIIPLEYSVIVAALCDVGYTVINVNYTGSIGFGDAGVRALEGQIGVLEVDEVASVIQKFKSCYRKIFLLGGSHGGYIGAMISAKYPDLLNGCILRNPVIDLPSMHCGSDIQDWPFGQMNIPYSLDHPRAATAEELTLLHSHSPSAIVKNVKCPTLIMVGERDLRVPPFQGKLWYRWLKAQGVDAEIISFPDTGHSLDSAIAEKTSLKAILLFFEKYASS